MAGGGCSHRSPAALRRRRLQAIQRSDTRIIQSGIDVKFWAQVPPSCSAVRPASCPGCGAASREPGKSLRVVGHGLRGRDVEGPEEPEAGPASRTVLARRYRCLGCGAVLVVVPRGVARTLRYTLDAIGYALALWGYAQRTAEQRCQIVIPDPSKGLSFSDSVERLKGIPIAGRVWLLPRGAMIPEGLAFNYRTKGHPLLNVSRRMTVVDLTTKLTAISALLKPTDTNISRLKDRRK